VLRSPPELADDRLDVTVEDREPLAGVADRERVGARVLRDRLPVCREPILAERASVPDGINLEEVLIGEPKLDHPPGELDRVGDPGIACPGVQGEQVPGQITDQPVGVVGVLDHLDDVTDRALKQLTSPRDGASSTVVRSSARIGRADRAHAPLSR